MSFKITLSPSGRRFICSGQETILEAALRHGIHLNYGCRSGRCGTCLGLLMQGTVKYDKDYPATLKLKKQPVQNSPYATQALYCCAKPISDLKILSTEIDITQALKPKRMPTKVIGLEKLCHDVMRVILKLPENIRVPFMAGQYLDIFQPDDGERRSFSIANAPHNDENIELHIRQVQGGEFTDYIFHELKLNDILRIEMPLGTFFLRENSRRPVILMGGGTGFAPLKGIIEHALHIGDNRPFHLFWGVRTQNDLYMDTLARQWQNENENIRYSPVLSESDNNNWTGEVGFVHEIVLKTYPDLSAYDLYMSGPPIMINTARALFIDQGLPVDRMYSDAFEYNAHPDAN